MLIFVTLSLNIHYGSITKMHQRNKDISHVFCNLFGENNTTRELIVIILNCMFKSSVCFPENVWSYDKPQNTHFDRNDLSGI